MENKEPKPLEKAKQLTEVFGYQSPLSQYATKDGATYSYSVNNSTNEAFTVNLFYSGVRFISENLAILPKNILKKNGKRREQAEHYLSELITLAPNPQVNAIYLWELFFAHAAVFGNGYIWIQRESGKVKHLWNVHPSFVKSIRKGNEQFYRVFGLDDNNQVQTTDLPYRDVLHLRNFSIDGEEGISVIDKLAESIRLPKTLEQFLVSYFENGAAVNLAVEMNDPEAEQADVDLLKYGLKKNHVGLEKAHEVMVVVNATAKNLTSPLKEFSFDVLRQVNVIDISNALRIPPHVLYSLVGSNYNSLEWVGTELVKFSFLPHLIKAETEMALKLFTKAERDSGLYFKFNVEGLQRGDFKTRAEVGVMLYTNNLITKNEWRLLEDYEPDEIDGDKYLRMLNMALGPSPSGEPTPSLPGSAEVQPTEDSPTPTEATGAALEAAPMAPLNGAQIQAAVDVIVQLKAGVLTAEAALGLLIAVGLSEEVAAKMVSSTIASGPLETVTDSTPTPQEAKPIDPPQDSEEAAQATEEKAEEKEEASQEKPLLAQYEKFIKDALERVKTKQLKAFSDAKKKDGEKYQEWLIKFSASQGLYLADALNPFLETVVKDAGLLAILLQSIAEKYEAQVKAKGEEASPEEITNQIIQRIENENS